MIHPDTELRFISAEIGYGVFAIRPIPRGTLIWTLCLFDRIFTPAEAQGMPAGYQDVLSKYSYIDLDGNHVLCWDAGRYVNHSCDPAMLGVDRGIEITLRDLQPGDEITCEYGSLNITNRLTCRCQSPKCRGMISGSDARELWRDWDNKVASALQDAGKVPQPLLAYSLNPELFNDYAGGLRQAPSYREHYAEMEVMGDCLEDSDRPWAIRQQPRKLVSES